MSLHSFLGPLCGAACYGHQDCICVQCAALLEVCNVDGKALLEVRLGDIRPQAGEGRQDLVGCGAGLSGHCAARLCHLQRTVCLKLKWMTTVWVVTQGGSQNRNWPEYSCEGQSVLSMGGGGNVSRKRTCNCL